VEVNDLDRVEHTGPISFEGWFFDLSKSIDFDALIAKAAAEAIENTLKESPPDAILPSMWGQDSDGCGGPGVSEPDAIYFSLPALSGSSLDVGPTWKTSISQLVFDFMHLFIHDHEWSDEGRIRSIALRDKLVELVGFIDEALAEPNPAATYGNDPY
jgi:hypothetical protein